MTKDFKKRILKRTEVLPELLLCPEAYDRFVQLDWNQDYTQANSLSPLKLETSLYRCDAFHKFQC